MNLTSIIQYLYPSAVPFVDFVVEADAEGRQFLRRWSASLGDQPTQAAISAAALPVAQTEKIGSINEECRARLLARYGPPEEQVSRSIGVYGATEQQAMKEGIAATIDASNVASNAVISAPDITTVEAVTVTWPAI